MWRTTLAVLICALVATNDRWALGQESGGDQLASSTDQSVSVCRANEVFNGKSCMCAPGYFKFSERESRLRCEDECEEVYHTFFTYGACVNDIFGRLPRDVQPECNLRCGVRMRTWASVGVFATFAAAVATLIFTLPVCIATCMSCLSARKASKTAKRVYVESQNQTGKEQQLQTLSYNPYAYWPYYGRG